MLRGAWIGGCTSSIAPACGRISMQQVHETSTEERRISRWAEVGVASERKRGDIELVATGAHRLCLRQLISTDVYTTAPQEKITSAKDKMYATGISVIQAISRYVLAHRHG
jgi:hypothetical protein